MDDVKLPNLSRIDDVKKRLKQLPPQESVCDTSNWENRNVSAPVIDVENKKTTIRQIDFMRPEGVRLKALTLAQIQKLDKDQSKN